ncbi:sensor histidine kinase [Pullulanibacillus sp. KACC 23026]|uniref:sensor histidine kinase n=1 Tax=Pullulanibacillus sp. KACC 23026 TaxID=3028315 RepID=UPI0023B15A9D|nr:sensor histidine kinase [Pullulanibacillus sp. KACC 23026]WEG14751.1 sensor histidine kinase [Pullulanibacillus sp. KACC 23026]
MIRIRTKLLLFFLVLIVLLNSIAYFLFRNEQDSIRQYDRFLSGFFLLNQVSQKTDSLYQSLETYLNSQSNGDYQTYLKQRKQLVTIQNQLPSIQTKENTVSLENYENMIISYLDESERVVNEFKKNEVDLYSKHLTETENIQGYIHQTTLDLINSALTNYNGFYSNLRMKDSLFQNMGLCIFVSSVFLGFLFAFWFSRGITKPIRRLTAAAEEISKGNFDGPPVKVSTRDEMQFLTQTFNDMRKNIVQLIGEIHEKAELDRLLKEMELKSLQSQINPHFLFNVLNTISKKAYLEEAEEISELIDSVAAMLRYNLGQLNQPVTLEQEVRVIKDYVYIQTTRFQDRVVFELNIDEKACNIFMPNLTLQPLVENAFIHGIEPYEEAGKIVVNVKDFESYVQIEVRDTGKGMDQETIHSILSEEEFLSPVRIKKSGHSTGIGVKNVIRRLQLFYQKKEVVEIESTLGSGTTIRLLLPKKANGSAINGGERIDTYINCG